MTDFLLFFSLNVADIFFFTHLVKHGHIAPDYRLQNHIHTCLSHRDAPTQMQRGSGGGKRLYENHPSHLLQGPVLKLTPPSHPCAGPIFSIFSLFLAKENLLNYRSCVSLEEFFFLGCTHESSETFRPVLLCGDPLPELSSDILPPRQNKSTPWEVLGLLLPGA